MLVDTFGGLGVWLWGYPASIIYLLMSMFASISASVFEVDIGSSQLPEEEGDTNGPLTAVSSHLGVIELHLKAERRYIISKHLVLFGEKENAIHPPNGHSTM